MGTATLIRRLAGFKGDARLYRLDPAISYDEQQGQTTEHVIVSAAARTGPETYIFPADADGRIASWGELQGSFQGGFDHAEALRGAGYEIIEPEPPIDGTAVDISDVPELPPGA
jgi:hypothetical protein